MTDIAKRNAANRRRGAQWQSDLRNGLRESGLDVERLVLTGKEDEGDLVVRDFAKPGDFVVIEAKAGQLHVTDFVRQALAEGGHFAAHRSLDRARVASIAVVKRRGMNWKDALVLTTVGDYFGLTR
ncbi:hypothetical protein [Umezawaea sp. Da 62-37]|uniref:hypothetical protein n=1 Tax=Umezawaea sp. Da 62-37 TaxID=3075927 RepID=UPI0028F6DE81|nr:hypothetical protein [Umezawaea sp. Da 62-37]WNV90332.1 hypothetical protein RM788_19240 [Umezawaea sp. Da 62-37]